MNERDFDKIISKKLKNEESDYPNLDANWQKVKDKMANLQDQKPSAGGVVVLPNLNEGNRGNRRWIVPTLLLSLLALLGMNGWLFWRLSKTTETNTPTTLNANQNQNMGQTIRLYDTIVETKVVYKIDTVYKKVVVYQSIMAQSTNNAHLIEAKKTPSVSTPHTTPTDNKIDNKLASDIKSPLSTASNDIKAHISDATNTASSVSNQQINHAIPTNVGEKKQTIDSSQSPQVSLTDSLNTKLKSPLDDTMHYAKVPYDSLEMKPTESLQKIIKAAPKKAIVDYYTLGLQSGTSWTIPLKEGVEPSFWYGLAGEIAFKNQLRLGISLDNTSFQFKTKTRDPLLSVPADPPMTENYDLEYIEGKPTSIQAGIGLTYLLSSKSRFKPLISVGYMRRWVLPYEAEFEFTNKVTGDHRSFDVSNTNVHKDNWLNLGIGVETQLLRRLNTRLKAEYIYDPNHGNIGLNQFLLRGGIYWAFGH